MIEYKSGDIFAEDTEALVNSVNCVGVMGRGIALQFRKAFPENFKVYAKACKREEVRPGQMFVFETGTMLSPRYIINFPTKRHWRGKSRMEDIESGLASLVTEIRERGIRSISIPALGSDLGGLNWPEVRARMQAALEDLDDVKVVIFEPGGGPVDTRANRSTDVPKMTPGRAVMVELMARYLRGLLDPFVTLLEVHKLMYFAQNAGEPLRLRFKEGYYGPYAENLPHVLKVMEGHFVSGYDDENAPDKELNLVPGAREDAHAFLANHPETQARFERVADCIEGFESSFGLELLSTVHWVVSEKGPQTFDDVVDRTYAWNERKKQFSRRQLKIAVEVLSQKGWIENLSPSDTDEAEQPIDDKPESQENTRYVIE